MSWFFRIFLDHFHTQVKFTKIYEASIYQSCFTNLQSPYLYRTLLFTLTATGSTHFLIPVPGRGLLWCMVPVDGILSTTIIAVRCTHCLDSSQLITTSKINLTSKSLNQLCLMDISLVEKIVHLESSNNENKACQHSLCDRIRHVPESSLTETRVWQHTVVAAFMCWLSV